MKRRSRLCQVMALILSLCMLLSALPFYACAAEEGKYIDLDGAVLEKNQVLMETEDFTISVKDLRSQNNGFLIIELNIKNNSRKTLYFRDEGGRIDRFNVSSGLYATVKPGKQVSTLVSVDVLPLAAVGLTRVKELQLDFDLVDDSNYQVLEEGLTMTIPLEVPFQIDYFPYEKVIYEEDAFSLTLLGSAKVHNRKSPSLIFRLNNELDGPIFARNDGELTVYDNQYQFFVHADAYAYTDAVFSVHSSDDIFAGLASGMVAFMDFPLQINTSNYNPLVDTHLEVSLTEKGKIQQCFTAARKSVAYDISMGEYGRTKESQHKNMFLGTFDNYTLNREYAEILRKKYPGDTDLYSERCFLPYVNELLTLYLAKLDEEGFHFSVIERTDLCTENAYVVELTENGKSLIQISFNQMPYDPKAAQIMTLGCESQNYEDLDTLNRCLDAMWLAYDMLNIHMTPEKHASLIENSESTVIGDTTIMLRGQCDGLGYVQSTSPQNVYLIITPDLTLPVFEGMNTSNIPKVGDTFYFGTYEQDNVASNGAEAIQWQVLDEQDGMLLAVTVKALDTQRFHKTAGNVLWKDCTLRTWLNGDFYNTAFSKEEKARIVPTQVELKAGKDKVFLLSRDETEVYFPTTTDRLCKSTEYAVAQKAYVSANTGCSWWLLRTAATVKGKVMSVNADGTMDYDGGRVESDYGTVRPAIWIKAEG